MSAVIEQLIAGVAIAISRMPVHRTGFSALTQIMAN
jgi:hypothetical protein